MTVAEATRSPGSSPHFSTRRLLGLFLLMLGVSFAGIPARLGSAGMFVGELAMVALGAFLMLRLAPLRLASGGRHVWRAVTTLVALIALGQLVRDKKLYPLMPYTMYGRAARGDINVYEFEALHRSGTRDRFRPSTVVATLGRARIVRGLSRQLDAIAGLESQGRPATSERALLQDTMAALVSLHNQEHSSDPVVAVDVLRVALPPPYDVQRARRQTVVSLRSGVPQ